MATNSKTLDTFPGARYWKSMQGAVDAILTPMNLQRRVISTGTQFVNYDAWTGEAFAHKLCDFFAANPDRVPTRNELTKLLDQANGYRCRDPHIRVARMPDRVTLRVARAIIGGGYHEAWHTKYSKRDRVRRSEIQPILDIAEQVTLAGGEFDAKMRGLLMTLHHLVEDIRIERRGNEDFEGAKQAMVDLQDFILDLEAAGRERGAKVKNVTVSMNARSIMLCAFRDLGLGYNSHKARQMIDFYKTHAPGAIALLTPGGLLAPMLHEAKNLEREDKMGSLRVAMKIVVELWRVTQQEPEKQDEGMSCPQCGAGPKDLIIRSVKNENGVKVKGRAELECKACGFKHEFDLPDNSLNLNQQEDEKEKDEDQEKPEVEDLDDDDVGGGADGFGDDTREQMRDEQKQEEQQNQQSSSQLSGGENESDEAESGEKGSQSSNSTAEGNEKTEGDGDGENEEDNSDGPDFEDLNGLVNDEDEEDSESDGEEEGNEGASSGSDGDEDGEDSNPTQDASEHGEGDEEGDDEGSSTGDTGDDDFDEAGGDQSGAGDDSEGGQDGSAGGGDQDDEESGDLSDGNGGGDSGQAQTAQDGDEDWEMSGEDFESAGGAGGLNQNFGRDYESDLRQAMEIFKGNEGDGVMTNQSALDEALADQNRQELKDVEPGERVWNPMDPSLDEARIVRPHDPADSLNLANTMLSDVRSTVAYLGARLRTIVKAQEMNAVAHGVRRGRKLSQRTLVDTAIDIRSGRMPTRAYQMKDPKVDTSIDMAICLDQSSSMDEIQYQVAQVQMILAESVERIGGGTFAFGFRNGVNMPGRPSNWRAQYHRTEGIRYDVFKTWDEKFNNVKARFAHTLATGTTPMSDGVQFGLMALEGRRAAHRVLAVITDGRPDGLHDQVIRRQIRLAREGGIQIIGIGIGNSARYVFNLFGENNAVWSEKVSEMPNELLKKLNELCDFSGRFRGRRPKLDGKGKMTRKVS